MASDPSAQRPVNVLFVCLGNICRSTMAEGVFRNVAQTHDLIGKIDSAGTAAYHAGEGPDSRTMATLRRHGITGYKHAARRVTKEDFVKFDYVLGMDQSNLQDLLEVRDSVVAGLRRKAATSGDDVQVAEVRLFGDFGKGGKLHARVGGGEVVDDPYYGGANGFEEVYKQVVRFSESFLEYLESRKS
ncbi:hypothetical protein PDE_01858 [Penicillium oxalicum 114-2]|uniref:Phosphotyrosine protein phosphatase I domain-containing protein n=1 Tax=Penicillium oxalicum (strain 114-2 / CGMCC 5302) TaxID=933388 RepID=S8AM28_PENO1|nr:hypothetical protein PDE_01858 [Penicillium oxalicum 114-2]